MPKPDIELICSIWTWFESSPVAKDYEPTIREQLIKEQVDTRIDFVFGNENGFGEQFGNIVTGDINSPAEPTQQVATRQGT